MENLISTLLVLILSVTGGLFIWNLGRRRGKLNQRLDEKASEVIDTQNNYNTTPERVKDAFVGREVLYQQLIHHLPEAIYNCDNEGRILFYNQAAVNLWGRVPEVGKDLWCGSWKLFKPDGTPLALEDCPMAIALKEKRAIPDQEIIIQRPDGIQRYVLAHPSPLFDSSRKVIGAVNILIDITEQKKAAAEIVRAKSRLRAILENTDDIIWSVDSEYKLLFCNSHFKKFVKLLTGKEIDLGDDIKDFVPDLYSDELFKLCERVLGGERFSVELERTLAGRELIFEYFFNPIRNVQDEVTGISAFMRNITDRKKAEAERIKAYREKETVLNRITDSVVSVDNEWRYTFLNDAAMSTHPLGRQETLGKVIWDVHPEMEGTVFWDKYHEAMLTRKAVNIESHYAPMDIWFSVRVYPSSDGLTIFYTDITERKKVEEALRQSQIFIESVINASPDIIYIYDIEERENVYVNQGIQHNLGYTNDDIRQMGSKVLPTLMHPEDFEYYLKNIYPKYETANDKEIIRHEFRMRDKNGEWHWFYFKESIFLRKPDGIPKQIFGITSNITERKRTEDLIRNSEAQLAEAQAVTKVGSWETDLLNLKVIWSKETYRIFGVDADIFHASHQGFLEFVHPEDRARVDEAFVGSLDKPGTNTIEHRILTPEGLLKFVEERWKIINDDQGLPVRALGTCQDVTERKKVETELQYSYQQLQELTAHLHRVREEERTRIAREIHDELGQQLTGLKMDASWIGKKIAMEDKSVKEKLGNMISLIDETVKTVRRIASELRPGILDDLGLLPALEWQCEEFEKRTGIKSHFQTDLSDFNPERNLSTNIFRLYQEALTNIARHANATSVETLVEQRDGHLWLIIRDNGQGFDLEEVKKKHSLGLIGMKERALMLRGELSIESDTSAGTVIILKIPLLKDNANVLP